MSNTVDIITCDQATFLKYLEENKLKDANFLDMFNKFNENYVQVAQEICELNVKRLNLLHRKKLVYYEYKKHLKNLEETKPEESNFNKMFEQLKEKDIYSGYRSKLYHAETESLIDINEEYKL